MALYKIVAALALMAPMVSAHPADEFLTLEKRGMTYRDNRIHIKGPHSWGRGNPDNVDIRSGKFKITQLSITPGQDPKGENQVGQTKSWTALKNEQQVLKFQCGRSKTKAVADFWNREIGKERNTYNKNPKKLNYAFIGDLTIVVPHQVSGDVEATFEGMGFAQGSTMFSNNWWLGGKNCRQSTNKKYKENTIECTGKTLADTQHPKSLPCKVYFRRGDNDANTVRIDALEYL